jgi:hypothetical protein
MGLKAFEGFVDLHSAYALLLPPDSSRYSYVPLGIFALNCDTEGIRTLLTCPGKAMVVL